MRKIAPLHADAKRVQEINAELQKGVTPPQSQAQSPLRIKFDAQRCDWGDRRSQKQPFGSQRDTRSARSPRQKGVVCSAAATTGSARCLPASI